MARNAFSVHYVLDFWDLALEGSDRVNRSFFISDNGKKERKDQSPGVSRRCNPQRCRRYLKRCCSRLIISHSKQLLDGRTYMDRNQNVKGERGCLTRCECRKQTDVGDGSLLQERTRRGGPVEVLPKWASILLDSSHWSPPTSLRCCYFCCVRPI